jgi:hypothetical protein
MDEEGKFSNPSSDKDQEEVVSNQNSDTDEEVYVRTDITETRKMFAHTADIEVVYIDDTHKAAEIIDKYEQWLMKEKYKFVGLDFEYCDPEYKGDYRIAVVQLSMNNHVLVYQWSRYDISTCILFFLLCVLISVESRFFHILYPSVFMFFAVA